MEENKKPARHDAAASGGELEELKKKCEEYLNGWKRERADFLNYKKEEMERIGYMAKYANQELILKILPILDNIYLAEQHAPKDSEWFQGFLQIQNQFLDLLKKEGVEPIEVLGKEFDPNTMEVVEEVENSGDPMSAETIVENGTVVEEVQKGYTLHGKLIRPAKVKISG